ncbi:MAG: aspartyl/asparaginyl beta-hydroxylase domain-containing protein [Lysobacterales bacterium]
MISNEQFTFIHVHKTGGRSLNSVITQCIAGSETVGYHYPHALVPATRRHLPIVGVVRNPWDWYVSWYAFNRRLGLRNPLFVVVSDGGKADFKTTVRNLLFFGAASAESCAYRSALAAILPEEFGGDRGAGLTRACVESCKDPERGYYSWLFERMLGGAEPTRLHIARFENLHADFIAIMRRLSVDEADALDATLRTAEKKNTSNHSHYSQYYDAELRELVGERERGLIDAYGYVFEDAAGVAEPVPLPAFYSYDVGFRKLLNRERNFLLLRAGFEIAPLRQKVAEISDQEWAASGREKQFHAHRHTQSIILASDNFKHLPPTWFPAFSRFESVLQPVLNVIAGFYGGDGAVLRVLLVRLSGGEAIDPHVDEGMSLLHCHRIHVPIITHPEVSFCVGGEKRHLAAGEIWEINNATVHYVENFSAHDRVHLIVDWAPAATLQHRERIAGVAAKSPGPSLPPPPFSSPSPSAPARNDPCPCGSGQRFKHCHGKLA